MLREQARAAQARAVAQVVAADSDRKGGALHVTNGVSLPSPTTTGGSLGTVTVGQKSAFSPAIPLSIVPPKGIPASDEDMPGTPGTIRISSFVLPPEAPQTSPHGPASPTGGTSSVPLTNSTSRGWLRNPAALQLLTGVPPGAPDPFVTTSSFFHPPPAIPEGAAASSPPAETAPLKTRQPNIQAPSPKAIITPSLTTLEKAISAKIYFENLYFPILRRPPSREQVFNRHPLKLVSRN